MCTYLATYVHHVLLSYRMYRYSHLCSKFDHLAVCMYNYTCTFLLIICWHYIGVQCLNQGTPSSPQESIKMSRIDNSCMYTCHYVSFLKHDKCHKVATSYNMKLFNYSQQTITYSTGKLNNIIILNSTNTIIQTCTHTQLCM